MPSTQYEPRRLYYLHVFKDTPGSNWTNPTVHVFPLSSRSSNRFGPRTGRFARPGQRGAPGNRDGIVNLYRLPTDQLSFLEQYLGKLNTEVEENKANLLKNWKSSIERAEKERFDREMKKNEEKMKLLELKQQYLKEKKQKTSASVSDKQDRGRGKDLPQGRYTREARYDSDSDGTARDIGYNDIYPMPPRRRYRSHRLPSPPRGIHYGRRATDSGPSPVVFETHWTIEDVELSFVPEVISLVPRSDEIGARTMGNIHYLTNDEGQETREHRKSVKLEVSTNRIAPESLSSFAVVLSRCTGVEIPTNNSINMYSRENSPARSYRSDYSADPYDDTENEVAQEVTIENITLPGPIVRGIRPGPPPAPPFDFWSAPPPPPPMGCGFMSVPPPPPPPPPTCPAESDACSVAESYADCVETESRAGEDGEDCGEGVVYVNEVRKSNQEI